jgi:lipoprotein-anchoring transpeptidase ErfK/SrfK
MSIRGWLGQAAIGACALTAAAALPAGPASAQSLFWEWGGGTTVGGSGREVVRFNPQYPAGQIIVSFGDRRLYLVTRAGEAISYPIAIPREQSRWQGVTSVTQKRVSPSWTPTPTMIAENPRLPRWVPGGHPMNPLGVRALYLGSSTYRIHGTDAPWTIGSAVSKGCIRLYNQDVLDLYPRVPVGTKVTVTYQRYTTAPAVSSAPQSGGSNGGYSGGGNSGGTFFDLFGGDDEPEQKAPPRARPKAKSASVERSASVRPVQVKSAAAAKPVPAAADASASAEASAGAE